MTGVIASLHAAGPGLPKERTERLKFVADYGAQGDRHAGKDPQRALLVTSASSYHYFTEHGLRLPYGSLGENVVVQGLELEALPPAARLQVGEAVLELTASCTVCRSLSPVELRLPKLAYGRRGVYAAVVQGGVVREGDAVHVIGPLAKVARGDRSAAGRGSGR